MDNSVNAAKKYHFLNINAGIFDVKQSKNGIGKQKTESFILNSDRYGYFHGVRNDFVDCRNQNIF